MKKFKEEHASILNPGKEALMRSRSKKKTENSVSVHKEDSSLERNSPAKMSDLEEARTTEKAGRQMRSKQPGDKESVNHMEGLGYEDLLALLYNKIVEIFQHVEECCNEHVNRFTFDVKCGFC